ncbi:unnamed protein product, partial [Closterium sp. NIES-54]
PHPQQHPFDPNSPLRIAARRSLSYLPASSAFRTARPNQIIATKSSSPDLSPYQFSLKSPLSAGGAMVLGQLQAKYQEIEGRAKAWVARQPPPVEVAIVAAASALQGGAIGAMMGSLTSEAAGSMPSPATMPGMTPEAAASMKQMQALTGGPWTQARNFAVMTGVNAGITAAMKRARGGVEDLQTRCVLGCVGGSGERKDGETRGSKAAVDLQMTTWSKGDHVRGGGTGPCTYVLRTGDRAGEQCGGLHSTQRCFGRLTDAWRHQFPDATEIPRWGDLSRAGVAIFDLDYDAILAAMYAVSTSDEGDCYLCLPPDPGGEAAALGACEAAAQGACEAATLGAGASAAPGAGESALSVTESAQVFHTFTLDSDASRSFFRDRTTLTPLSRPVAVSLADPSGGPDLASFSTVLPCPAAPSGAL